MDIPLLFGTYLVWHYSEALGDIFRITGNFVWFFWNMFSVKLLTETLVSPFKRIQEEKTKAGLDFGDIFSRLIINTMMRFVGLIVRLAIIICGLIFIILSLIAGVVVFAVWLVLPVAVVFLFAFGIFKLFSI